MSAVPRSYGAALLLLAGGGGLAFLSYGRTWATVTLQPAGLPATTIAVSGRDLAPGAGYLPLLLLAAVLAVWATSGWVRRVVGAVAAAGAVAVLVGALRFSPPVRGPLVTPDGVPAAVDAYAASAWWLPAAFGAAAAMAGAVLVVAYGHTWRGMGGRYQRSPAGTAGAAATAGPLTARAAWDLLDAGVDPTDTGPTGPGPDAEPGDPAGLVSPSPAGHGSPGTMPAPALPGRAPAAGGSPQGAPQEEEQ